MKIGYLGAGTWGTALAQLLSENGHEVVIWDYNPELIRLLDEKREHPKLKGKSLSKKLVYVSQIEEAIEKADLIVESVTAGSIRTVLNQVFDLRKTLCPLVLTSKGIEQKTGLLLPEIALEIFGFENRSLISCISGPSHAEEVILGLPTSVVCSSYDPVQMRKVQELFCSPYFRIYPNIDIHGICFGAAMKNIIAIACGISEALRFGENAKAALMTRGLHEIRKLSVAKNCKPETLNGLSGLGDLFVTCSSQLSRNNRFGHLIAQGYSLVDAKEKIGMVVEGAYTVVSAYELGKEHGIPLPITDATYGMLYEGMPPAEAVKSLLQRAIKEEHL
jgi:glycerol-3-phosphate dehydrogenase (NAD(P)+)